MPMRSRTAVMDTGDTVGEGRKGRITFGEPVASMRRTLAAGHILCLIGVDDGGASAPPVAAYVLHGPDALDALAPHEHVAQFQARPFNASTTKAFQVGSLQHTMRTFLFDLRDKAGRAACLARLVECVRTG